MSVIVYTKPQCPNCVTLKRNLDTLNVPYETRDVTLDQGAYDDVVELGYQALPVTVVFDDDPDGIDDWLGPLHFSGSRSVVELRELLGV